MSFFDELGKTISDTGKNVAKKAKDLAEITSLNSQISTNEGIRRSWRSLSVSESRAGAIPCSMVAKFESNCV